jgi:hypothetical protein
MNRLDVDRRGQRTVDVGSFKRPFFDNLVFGRKRLVLSTGVDKGFLVQHGFVIEADRLDLLGLYHGGEILGGQGLGRVGSEVGKLIGVGRCLDIRELGRFHLQSSVVAADLELVLWRLGRCFDGGRVAIHFIRLDCGEVILSNSDLRVPLARSELLTDRGVFEVVLSIGLHKVLGADRLGVDGRWGWRGGCGCEPLDGIDQLFCFERFGDDLGATDRNRTIAIEGLKGPCQEDDRKVEEIGARLDFLTHIVAVTARHDDVADYEIRSGLGESLEELVAARHRHDLVLGVCECELNDLLDGEAVIGKQDRAAHGSPNSLSRPHA